MSTNLFNPIDKRKYPSRWPLYRGKQLFRVIDERSDEGTEDLLSVSHITGITPRSKKNVTMFKSESLIGYKLCQMGDIVANTMWTWQGAIGVSKYEGVVSPAYNVYRQRKDYFNSTYLDMLLREHQLVDVYHSLSTGIRPSRLRLYPDVFLTIEFPVPPRAEQDQIVRFLDWKVSEINKLTSIRKKQIKQLEEIKEKQIENALSHFSCQADVQPLKAIAYCNRESLSESTAENYSFRYIDIGSVDEKEGITHYEEMKFKNAPSRARRIVHKNDIIISTVRTYLKAITRITDDKDVIVSTGFAVLSPHGVDSKYLEYYFKSKRFCDEVIRESIGIAYPAIDTSKLMRIKILVPKYEEQLAITAQVHKNEILINQTISLLKKKIKQLKELKSVIISDVVTGKIDVRNIPVPAYEHVDDLTADDGKDNDEETGIPGEED